MKSLAEHLGTAIVAEEDPVDVRDEDMLTMSVRDFARGILRSREYRRTVMQRVFLGTLPVQVEVLLYHYAEGKPVERLEVEDKTQYQQMSAEQLESRALQLASIARRIRTNDDSADEPSEPAADHIH